MNPIVAFLIRSFVAVPVTVISWLICFFPLDYTFWGATFIAVLSGALTHVILSLFQNISYLKKHQLSRKEYRYIKKNLKEAKQKIRRLNKSIFHIRDIHTVKQRIDINRITKKIHKMTMKEPKRFYKAEEFYFSHLDSLVELTEKYSFISSQPKQNSEMGQSLIETRRTLIELTKVVEDDLYHVISDDINTLNFEIDVAKHTIQKKKELKFPEENRWLK
ncbi:5-bromo-4-chloroindolyl phosphate hydrolysis family protein [Neobacillus cucumis]|uniref:5-bromo-4-chloroindolyl phosphate hydrolysis family protein n=1 Tax=Neobacillus cucumis TaxID=1740721 RepID=UPI0028536CB7|nr:5-bromo-4-chloroindolyl phosphate hydrolysis family protein [Neobacillus cucumis]MDR4949505.1 5-bromo-4-chloroindolyl phosphate hydrolysis family protein [Neobacillus cucumis]